MKTKKSPQLLFLLVLLGIFSVTTLWTTDAAAQRRLRQRQTFSQQSVTQNVQTRSTGQNSPQQTPTPKPEKQNYALLIGINKYAADTETLRRKNSEERGYLAFNSLKYCIADMEGLRNALVKGKYADKENIILLTDDNKDENRRPTCANIIKYLNEFNSKAKDNDAILVAFAGHGVALPSTQNNQNGTQSYLCPMDAEVSRNTDSGEWETNNSLIPLSLLFSGSEEKRGVRKIAILDACRNVGEVQGGGRSGMSFVRGGESQSCDLPNFQEDDLARFKKLDRFASCAEGQRAYEDPNKQHGVYSNFLIEGLGGKADTDNNGEITIYELAQYVAGNTYEYVQDTFKQEQSPTYSSSESVPFTIAFCTKQKIPPPPPPPIPPPPKSKSLSNPIVK
jgi:uncharacterized caspase-like protein